MKKTSHRAKQARRLARHCWLWMYSVLALAGVAAIPAIPAAANPEAIRLNEAFEQLSLPQQVLYKDLSEQLRCPTCTGLSVLQSDAAFSLQIRSAVLEQVKQGKSEAAILQFFTERYGLWILREPPKEGIHMLAWLIPLLLLLLGPLGLWFFVWRKRLTIKTFGLRPAEAILKEMEMELQALRKKGLT